MRNKLGRFIKGHKPYFSKKTRNKISHSRKGHLVSNETRRKIGNANKGRLVSQETIKKIKLARSKQIMKPLSKEHKRKISESNKGKKRSKETRKRIGQATIGRKYSAEINKKKGLPMSKHPFWKGGKFKNMKGYIYIKNPSHPFATKAGYIAEHRLVMEKKISRYLTKSEIVHHKNGIKDNNRPQNLELVTSKNHRNLKMVTAFCCPRCNFKWKRKH